MIELFDKADSDYKLLLIAKYIKAACPDDVSLTEYTENVLEGRTELPKLIYEQLNEAINETILH